MPTSEDRINAMIECLHCENFVGCKNRKIKRETCSCINYSERKTNAGQVSKKG